MRVVLDAVLLIVLPLPHFEYSGMLLQQFRKCCSTIALFIERWIKPLHHGANGSFQYPWVAFVGRKASDRLTNQICSIGWDRRDLIRLLRCSCRGWAVFNQ